MEDGIHILAYGHYSLKLRGFIGCDISVALFPKESTYLWSPMRNCFPERAWALKFLKSVVFQGQNRPNRFMF